MNVTGVRSYVKGGGEGRRGGEGRGEEGSGGEGREGEGKGGEEEWMDRGKGRGRRGAEVINKRKQGKTSQ